MGYQPGTAIPDLGQTAPRTTTATPQLNLSSPLDILSMPRNQRNRGRLPPDIETMLGFFSAAEDPAYVKARNQQILDITSKPGRSATILTDLFRSPARSII